MDPRLLLSQKLPTLSDSAVALAYELISRIGGDEHLADFIRRVSPHHPPPAHVQPLIAAIERARWQPVRLCVAMPPRHCKTITILHGLAWWILNSPADTCAYVSYSDRQAWSKSRVCRTLAELGGVRALGDSASASEWRTRDGGGLIAAGAMSGITGQGVHGLMVVDDPYKNREEADSEIIREKIWETFNEVVFTRLEGASVIVCHTRWHEDDLIGRLVGMEGWESINLKALAEDDDPLGREPGTALWPTNENFTARLLDGIRRQVGEWSFAALYQGQPRPRGHTLFGPEHYHEDHQLDGHRLVIYADPAASQKTTADYGVMMCMALKGARETQTARIIDLWRGQVTVPQFARNLSAFQQQHGGAPVWIEAVGGFKAVPQLLREIEPGIRLREDVPKGDKFQRAQSVAAAWNEGRVTVPRNARWLRPFLNELASFTGINDVHDDQVDCLSGCWNCGSASMVPQYHSFSGGWKPRR
jgi:predicted phage terminase large subunit-like protein